MQLYHEQMEFLEQWIYKEVSESWKQQYNMLKGQIETEKGICAIESIGKVGEKADYRIHEVIEVLAAENNEQEGTVAHVYSQGILYHGKVLKKARVQAYKSR